MSGIGGVGEEQHKAGDEKTGVTGLGRMLLMKWVAWTGLSSVPVVI